MSRSDSKRALRLGIAFLIAIVLFFGVALLTRPKLAVQPDANEPSVTESGATDETLKAILDDIQAQQEVDEALAAELEAGAYSLENPFVIVDPYGVAPLSALALFNTTEPMRISIHISGKTSLNEVTFTFSEYNTVHQIPILGLYAGEENLVTIRGETREGKTVSTTIPVITDPLPDDMKGNSVIAYCPDPSQYQPGMNFLNDFGNKYCANAIDASGECRWYLKEQAGLVHSYNKGKALYTQRGEYICEVSLMGKLLNVYWVPYGPHHDMYLTDRATLIVCANSKETAEDQLVEIDLTTGGFVHQLDYKDVLQRTRTFGEFYSNVDWMHMNAVVEHNGNLIVSSNYQSTIICNDWTGAIKWMLCDPTGYYDMYKPYFLTPIGEGFEYPYNQHAVEVLPDYDSDPDTLDILLFDNGSSRSSGQQANQNDPARQLYSRLVHYRINEKAMTVEQIWQYGKDRPELFALHRGDANLLENGNILGIFYLQKNQDVPDRYNISSVICEVNRDGKVIFECSLISHKADNIFDAYRVERLPLYWQSANDQTLGVPANILIPEEVLAAYGH